MPPAGAESYAFGLLVTAIDGTVFDLADTAAMREGFVTPSKGRFPQARMVALIASGNRWLLAARIASSGLSEQALADDLISQLWPGTINLADRGFFSMDRWIRAAATGAHLVWRVKNGAQSLPARLDRILSDASAWVVLHESDQMLYSGEPARLLLPQSGQGTQTPSRQVFGSRLPDPRARSGPVQLDAGAVRGVAAPARVPRRPAAL